MSSPDLIIASVLAQHTAEQSAIDAARAAEPVVTVTFTPNPIAPVKAKKIKASEAPKPTGVMLGLAGIVPGTLDAAAFMAAARKAGQRINDEGKPYFNMAEVRGDTIKAIAGYIGYDPRGDFGAQDIAARAQAMRDLKVTKVTAGPAVLRNASKSLNGFVSGLPDVKAKALANLRAQAEGIVETIAESTKAGDEGKVALERERLSHVRQQIRDMGFEE